MTLVLLARGDTDAARPLIDNWTERAARNSDDARAGETALILSAAFRQETTREPAINLLETAVASLAKSGDMPRLALAIEIAKDAIDSAKLREKFANEFDRVVAWHRTEAPASERTRQRSAAVWHWNYLIDAEPGNALPLLRRAAGHAGLGEHELAAADYAKAVKLGADARPALVFGGKPTHLSAPNVPFDELDAFAIETWVMGWHGPILCQGEAGDPENSVWLSLGTRGFTNPQDTIGWESGEGVNYDFAIGNEQEPGWHHVALVFDGKKQLIYLDGKLQRQLDPAPKPGPLDASRRLLVGAHQYGDVVDEWKFGSGFLGVMRVSKTARYHVAWLGRWDVPLPRGGLIGREAVLVGLEYRGKPKLGKLTHWSL